MLFTVFSAVQQPSRTRQAIQGEFREINRLCENQGNKLKEIRKSLSRGDAHPEFVVRNRIVGSNIDKVGILHKNELEWIIPYYYNPEILATTLNKSEDGSLKPKQAQRSVKLYNVMTVSAFEGDRELEERNTAIKRT